MGERSPRSRRFELNVVAVLIAALASVWVLGEHSAANYATVGDESGFFGNIAIGSLIVLVLANALFIAAETAVELLKLVHIKHYRETEPDRAAILQTFFDGKPKFATACLLGSRLARLGLVFFVLVLAQGFAPAVSHKLGLEVGVGFLLAIGIIGLPVVVVNLVVGELVPKSYASLYAPRVVLRLRLLIRVSSVLFSMPASVLVAIANLLAARFGGKTAFTTPNQAEEEIKTMLDTAEEAGQIESDERELIHSVFEFNDMVAREIMTPRVDLDAMPVRSNANDVVRLIEETGHSRIPLYEDTDDTIVGIIHAKDLLKAMVGAQRPPNLRALMRIPVFVPENKGLMELLQEMRVSRSQMAIVQDEFGGTAGIVTIEDILEELVGDISDEYDREEPAGIEVPGGWLVNGKLHLDDVNELIAAELESEEFDTIGGFIFGEFGRQPKLGESIAVDGYMFIVAETDTRRIQMLRIEKLDESPATEQLELL